MNNNLSCEVLIVRAKFDAVLKMSEPLSEEILGEGQDTQTNAPRLNFKIYYGNQAELASI